MFGMFQQVNSAELLGDADDPSLQAVTVSTAIEALLELGPGFCVQWQGWSS